MQAGNGHLGGLRGPQETEFVYKVMAAACEANVVILCVFTLYRSV